MSTAEILITGVIVIGLIGAFGTRAKDLSGLVNATGNTVSGLEGTVQKG